MGMNTGWKVRGFLLGIVFCFNIHPVSSKSGLEVYFLSNGQKVKNQLELHMMPNEIVGLEFIAQYRNETSYTNYGGWMKWDWRLEVPGFIEGWQNKDIPLAPGKSGTLRNVIYIHPKSVGFDSVVVWYGTRIGTLANTMYWFRVYVHVDSSGYEPPVLLSEPSFTRGLQNTVSWLPAPQNAIFQDAYCFEEGDRENLRRSIRQLYKSTSGDTVFSNFNDLVNGRKYGYFIKAACEIDDSARYIYSNIVYSTQDNTPPNRVVKPRAINKNSYVRISWKSVEDSLSGTARYRIYRAVNTGTEKLLVDSAFVALPSDSVLSWMDTTMDSGFVQYRVNAVDFVGNEGYGDWSNSITLKGGNNSQFPPENPVSEDTVSSSQEQGFRRGSVDTLWVALDKTEERIRFEVVRDDTNFFSNPPPAGMRYFDSGWVPPDTLPDWGWTSPTNPGSVFFVFDYTDTGGIYFDRNGVVHRNMGQFHMDPNFAHNHTYHRRVIRKYFSTTDTVWLEKIVPDCFPPEDIHNLRVEPIVEASGGTLNFCFNVFWQAAIDDGSGLKRYHVFRKIDGVDSDFSEITIGNHFKQTFLSDTVNLSVSPITNPIVRYRVTGEDNVGNIRDDEETNWEAHIRAPGAPILRFEDSASPHIFPRHPINADTIFTELDSVVLRVRNFDTSEVTDFIVSVNGKEQLPDKKIGQETLVIRLPNTEVTQIHVRAVYAGERSTIGSNILVVIRDSNIPPKDLKVWNDATYWKGNIHLRWIRPSLDAVRYEVWRNGNLIGSISSKEDTVSWIDYYSMNELSGESNDTLVAYKMYPYQIRKINMFGSTTTFSNEDSAYCNRAPAIVSSEIKTQKAENVIIIHWNRVRPSMASGSWSTRVRISKDNLANRIYETIDTTDVIDDTKFIFDGHIENGHNYIFQIRETPQYPPGRTSSWSQPFTVNLASIDSLFVLPQPKGKIFVSWDEDTLIDRLAVDTFEFCRLSQSDTVCWYFPSSTTSYMDPLDSLHHGEEYSYRVSALDSLGQILAANVKTGICDSGNVFIPMIVPFQYRYFNSDSVHIHWQWRDIQGNPMEGSTRGAVALRIRVSTSRLFPADPLVTVDTGWFPADSNKRSKKVKIPSAVNINNETVYCIITAKDRWGHPEPPIWSGTEPAIHDTILPNVVEDFTVASSEAYDGNSDSLLVRLQWTGKGVEWPGSDATHWNSLIANVHYYQIVRSYSEGIDTVAKISAGANTYSFSDTLKNALGQWKIVVTDSAQNSVSGVFVPIPCFIPTPPSLHPIDFKSCSLQILPSDSLEYFIEIAVDPDHFLWAHEIGIPGPGSSLLCQSGWTDTTYFSCMSGWGAIVMDTTWFRVKARWGFNWQSGWSPLAFYTENPENASEKVSTDVEEIVPLDFTIQQNYPNPFNAQTQISYDLPEPAYVEIRLYNIQGAWVRTLVEEKKSAGYFSAVWDGTDQWGKTTASGVYLVHVFIQTEQGKIFQRKMKMMMIK